MINNQEYITTELQKTLEKMIILPSKPLKNLVGLVTGIITSKSVTLPNISEELKDEFSKGNEISKITRLNRFLTSKSIDSNLIQYIFSKKIVEKIKSKSKQIYIIFDHTTIEDKFLILKFSLKVGKRGIPLWFKTFKYDEDDNKNFLHIKEGLIDIHKIFSYYEGEVILLADRGFRSVDLFKFIDENLKWKYCIRCTKDISISIEYKEKIKKLKDIVPCKKRTKYFKNILITKEFYKCNMAVCRADGKTDTWYIANNLKHNQAIREYKKRFTIEEMFRDLKSNGFDLEGTWSNDLTYVNNLYLCLCIAYTWLITLGVSCRKDKKNKLLGAVRNIKGKNIRVYSIFRTGLKWFKRCLNSSKKDYHLKFDFVLYDV